jgi:COP9 signalosome complex subunit 4
LRRPCKGKFQYPSIRVDIPLIALVLINRSDRTSQTTAVLEILHRVLKSSTPPPSKSLIAFATHLITSANTPLSVGRSALTALVLALGAGLSIDLRLLKPSLFSSEQGKSTIAAETSLDPEEQRFYQTGREVWESKNTEAFEARKTVVEGIINAVGSSGNESGSDGGRGWCEEQVKPTGSPYVLPVEADSNRKQITSLKHVLSYILELEEDWLAAAKVLIGIPLETTSRCAHPLIQLR